MGRRNKSRAGLERPPAVYPSFRRDARVRAGSNTTLRSGENLQRKRPEFSHAVSTAAHAVTKPSVTRPLLTIMR